MGEKPTEEYILGDPCPGCSGPGEPFEESGTPEFIEATVAGVTEFFVGSPLPNGTFKLTKFLPCIWRFANAVFFYQYTSFEQPPPAGQSDLKIIHIPSGLDAFIDTDIKCSTLFTNDLPNGGIVGITWGPEIF